MINIKREYLSILLTKPTQLWYTISTKTCLKLCNTVCDTLGTSSIPFTLTITPPFAFSTGTILAFHCRVLATVNYWIWKWTKMIIDQNIILWLVLGFISNKINFIKDHFTDNFYLFVILMAGYPCSLSKDRCPERQYYQKWCCRYRLNSPCPF